MPVPIARQVESALKRICWVLGPSSPNRIRSALSAVEGHALRLHFGCGQRERME